MRARIRVMVACWPMCVCVIVVQTTNNKMESAIWKLIVHHISFLQLTLHKHRTHMPCPNKQSMWAYAYWDGGVGSHNCTGHSKYERSARWHGTFMLSYRKRALQPLHTRCGVDHAGASGVHRTTRAAQRKCVTTTSIVHSCSLFIA